ncbi:glycosyltransferase family protein [Salinactinospora qingdaonensis]|uniref:Uncharacterized protein n=1 Tax=Salinactinospora qingdaonensis TaxID=702744 RepID=A0ABP7FI33_9ACTN
MADLTPEVRDLLTSIYDALNVPTPSDLSGYQERADLQRTRACQVLGALDAVLGEHGDAAVIARVLRDTMTPVTYPTVDEPGGGRQ